MDPSIKQQLMTRPIILAAIGAVFGVIFPHLASTLIAMVTERGFYTNAGESFSGLTYLIFVVIFASIGIRQLFYHKQLIKKVEDGEIPTCPICGFPMVERKDKNSHSFERKFWGCLRAPDCAGEREMV